MCTNFGTKIENSFCFFWWFVCKSIKKKELSNSFYVPVNNKEGRTFRYSLFAVFAMNTYTTFIRLF